MALPSTYYGGGPPRIARLPDVGNPAAREISEGLQNLNRSVQGAIEQRADTKMRVREMDLRTNEIERQRELTQRTGEGAAFLADEYGALQIDLINMRQSAGPGALGYEDKVEERIGKFRDNVMGHLGNDPELVGRFVDNVASFAASARVGEVQFAATSRAAYAVANVGKVPETLANSLYTSGINGEPLSEKVKGALALNETTVRSQPIPANAQQELIDKGAQTIWIGAVKGRIQYDPDGTIAAIDAGELNTTGLTNDQVTALRQQAVVLSNQRKSQAESAANEGAKVERANARNAIEDVNKAVIVDTAGLQAFRARAASSQDPEDIRLVHDLDIAIAKNEVTSKYDSATNEVRTAAVREIEGTKDWQKNNQLVAAHDALGALITRDTNDAKNDPLSLFARQTGTKLAPASLSDPASMQARFAIGDRAGERYDRPPTHLSEDEATKLREQWNVGSTSDKAALVETMGHYGPKRGRELMRQLAPNKPEFARLVELAAFKDPALKAYTNEALDGWAQPPQREGIYRSQVNETQRYLGTAFAMMPGERRAGILQVARGIYAHRATQAGSEAFNPTVWQESIDAALGKSASGGGSTTARDGSKFILPTGASRADFDLIMSRSAPADFRAAANGIPKWNNRDMTEGEFKRLTPVLINDTGTQALYGFRSVSGAMVKNERGDFYVLDYRQLLNVRRSRLQGR